MIVFCVFKATDFEIYCKYLNVIFPVETYKPQGTDCDIECYSNDIDTFIQLL